MRARPVELAVFGAILLFALVIRIALIDRPFHRDPEGCGSFYGLLARNYWRYDIRKTLGVPIQSMGVHEHPTLYPNHPPLVPMLIAAAFGIAGYTSYDSRFPPDWLVRLPTIPFTLGCILMIWLLLRRDNPRAALIAACVFAVVPMTLVFGGLADVISPQLDFFILLTVVAYLRFYEKPSLANLALLSLAFLPAALTDWPAHFMVVILCGHFVLTRAPRQWPWIISFGIIAVVFFLIPYLQVVFVTHDWKWIATLVERRALSDVADSRVRFTFVDWINKALVEHAIGRHTWPIMILATIWLGWRIAHPRVPTRAVRATTLVFAWAILHIFVGRQGVFVHEWWWWPLTPAVAMAAGLMIDQIGTRVDALISRQRANGLLAALLVFLAIYHVRGAFFEFAHPKRVSDDPSLNYSIVEIGEIIRESVPLNQAVMLAESDQTMSLWYYADRPIRRGVWDEVTFRNRLNDGSSDLLFGLSETWDGPAAVFIFPKAYRSAKLELFVQYLTSRYEVRQTPKFLVFDLRTRREGKAPAEP